MAIGRLRSTPLTIRGEAWLRWRRAWNCWVKAAPHDSWNPSYGTPSALGGSNWFRARASWGRKCETSMLLGLERAVIGGVEGLSGADASAEPACGSANAGRASEAMAISVHAIRIATRGRLDLLAFIAVSFS